ncbi:MAG: NAD(P)H-dependent oxidoreductase [Brevinemataceae bacterium]
MKKVGVWLSHPYFEDSIANKEIINHIASEHPEISIRNIDNLYPKFQVDVNSEQNTLINTDVIILQFPLCWYNVPAALKNWIDRVLTYNFVFEETEKKLKGKDLIISITVGDKEGDFSKTGRIGHSLEEYFLSFIQFASESGMNYKGITALYGCKNEIIEINELQQAARNHADKLVQMI